MRNAIILISLSLILFLSCKKDELKSKDTLIIEIINKNKIDYNKVKIYSGQFVRGEKGFVSADSISFSVKTEKTKIIKWKPKLLTFGGEGMLLIKLANNNEKYFGYYAAGHITGGSHFVITLLKDDINIIQK